ncbi:hypothetical protein [Cylindrospermum sp. FACHB-282]|uniref:hypothetical protein n=1 Tax=Cylindrospermum sp. FACHB-282 TaxID=2692794 RepID=UPI00168A12AC|nr:hypothetical protein [Cylindrospermum sp. FACHB-282]MBD2386424.1 hypothetical protein [Cylindrospermum sp. FACHB-282]
MIPTSVQKSENSFSVAPCKKARKPPCGLNDESLTGHDISGDRSHKNTLGG